MERQKKGKIKAMLEEFPCVAQATRYTEVHSVRVRRFSGATLASHGGFYLVNKNGDCFGEVYVTPEALTYALKYTWPITELKYIVQTTTHNPSIKEDGFWYWLTHFLGRGWLILDVVVFKI